MGERELLQFLKSHRGTEVLGIVILAIGITVGISLVTFHPSDPSAFFTSSSDEVSNAIGYYGATLAWVLVSFFGFASLLFPSALLILGWNRFWNRDVEYFHTKLIGFIVLLVTLPPLLDLAIGKVWFRATLVQAGGFLGHEIDRRISANLNSVGAAIALTTALLIGFLFATRISLASIFLWLKAASMAIGRNLSFRWARFTERRRKEKMKTNLIKKHLEKATPEETTLTPKPEEEPEPATNASGIVVRQVKGHGRFQIRKVTKADLRKAAEDIVQGKRPDPVELYSTPVQPPRPSTPPPAPKPAANPLVHEEEEALPFLRPVDDFEDIVLPAKPSMPKPAPRKPPERVKAKSDTPPEVSLSTIRLPYVNLLTPGPEHDTINDDVHKKFLEVGKLIEERCKEFSVDGEVTAYHPGPVVTTFEFKPSAGVKYAKVVNLGDDLALALKAESIRIERISGSSTVGIEVPNRKRELITLRDIIDTDTFRQSSSAMTLALGKDIHGEPFVTDLARMPHLLVAGATGAGKSVGLNSMIVSMLYKALPSQLRMLMIDPKMVELKIYEDIPHLLHPIVTDPKLASNALIWTVQEMENRYRTLAECGVRNIDQYNALLKDPEAMRKARRLEPGETWKADPMQYIIVVIDEFADLMMVAPKDVEDSVTRLAQKARAVGIHLIVATQRPSVDVITGVIKANFPSRISYQVASKIDSRTILDTQGAEKLLGNGDMLFLPPGTARIKRIHGAYVSEKEIVEIVDFVKKYQGKPEFVEEITKSVEEKTGADGIEYLSDPKYDEAVRVVLSTGQASASYLQRRLKLGYSRAARLVEIMEANGIVGPSQGSKPREILIRADDYPGMMDPASNQ